jgi:hypothetical protein
MHKIGQGEHCGPDQDAGESKSDCETVRVDMSIRELQSAGECATDAQRLDFVSVAAK